MSESSLESSEKYRGNKGCFLRCFSKFWISSIHCFSVFDILFSESFGSESGIILYRLSDSILEKSSGVDVALSKFFFKKFN